MMSSCLWKHRGFLKPISEDVKLKVFQFFADSLFSSFDNDVFYSSFVQFSDCIINWLEHSCKSEVNFYNL